MNHPYTDRPAEAFAAAHAALALTWGALLARRRVASCGPRWILFTAFCAAAIAPLLPRHWAPWVLDAAAALPFVAIVTGRERRWRAALAAAGGCVALVLVDHAVVDSDFDLSALSLLAMGALTGWLARRPASLPASAAMSRGWSSPTQDAIAFVAATALGAIVSIAVLERGCTMDDEWAYTFQADLFAHWRAYAPIPACAALHENNWIYNWQGRTFTQFTPGWPLFMAPFARLGVPWLASPVSLGLLASGVARLSRRVAAHTAEGGDGDPTRRARAIVAGAIGAVSISVGASVLLNAGSRFSHVFVAAAFAWAIEGACAIAEDPPLAHRRARWGALVGACVAAMVSARPADGALLGLGVMAILARAIPTRRIDRVSMTWAAGTLATGLTLTAVILRLQLGAWFRTGYSLTETIHPWAKLVLSWPNAREWAYALPLGAGTYCWWPCVPALGAAGLMVAPRSSLATRGLAISSAALAIFYVTVDFGRQHYWAYGPRYQLPVTVALAVGGAVWCAPLFTFDRERAWRAVAAGVGVATALALAFIGSRIYAIAAAEAHARGSVFRAIRREHLHHAVVWVGNGEVAAHPTSLTQTSPTDPDPDVVVLILQNPDDRACAQLAYPGRRFYRALGLGEVTLVSE